MDGNPCKTFRDGLVLPSQQSKDRQSSAAEDGAQHSAQPPLKVPIADGLQEPLLLAGTLRGASTAGHPTALPSPGLAPCCSPEVVARLEHAN